MAEARRGQGLTQSALAAEIGCKQSALSAFEAGTVSKLSEEFVKKLATRLDVSLEPPPAPASPAFETVFVPTGVKGFCPSCACPSNVPYLVDGRLFFRPEGKDFVGPRCVWCGELIETRCPACGAPLNGGACCAVCGSPYVTAVAPAVADLAAWASARRDEIRSLRT